MTAQGSPLSAYRRAVRARDAHSAFVLAHEVAKMSLADALALTLLMRDHDPIRYDRLAARLQGRAMAELGGEFDDAALLSAAFAAVRHDATLEAGVVALKTWLQEHDARPAVVELEAWVKGRREREC